MRMFISTHISSKFNMLWNVFHNSNSLTRFSLNIIPFYSKTSHQQNMHPNFTNSMKKLATISVLIKFSKFSQNLHSRKIDTVAEFGTKTGLLLQNFITPNIHLQISWNFVVNWQTLRRIFRKMQNLPPTWQFPKIEIVSKFYTETEQPI